MISFSELIKPQDTSLVDENVHANLCRLHFCLNVIRVRYGFPLTINRAFASPAEQVAIYAQKNQAPKLKSWHLFGGAADIADPDQKLQQWLLENLQILEELGLYCEAFEATSDWVHLQIYPPASGHRFFEP